MLNKSFPKKNFCKEPYFEMMLSSLLRKIFEQNLYRNLTVYLLRIWTYKNADEKALTF